MDLTSTAFYKRVVNLINWINMVANHVGSTHKSKLCRKIQTWTQSVLHYINSIWSMWKRKACQLNSSFILGSSTDESLFLLIKEMWFVYYLFIYLIAFTMLTIQDIRTKDKGAGHPTHQGSKLRVPLR